MKIIPKTALVLAAGLVLASLRAASGQTCTSEQIAEAVDRAGANLRRIMQEHQPRIDAKIAELRKKRGWSDADGEEKAYGAIADARGAQLEDQANERLAKVDQLGAIPSGATSDCGQLRDLEAAALELQATVRAKAQHTIARLDALLGEGVAAPVPATPPATKPTPPAVAMPAPPSLPPAAGKPAAPWATTTTPEPPSPPPAAPATPTVAADDGYSIEEIAAASTGFFGKVSTGLASLIEHAFAKVGRPTGYILGDEGGGAFLAGLRYGKGTLYLRSGGTMPIHWHGPSLGTDIGASGAKVMFLVYRVSEPDDLANRFTGVEGAAYLVGGVGFTLLTNGRVQMAPIRSGLGLRLGASVGYLRFTRKPTWNPF